MIGLDTNILVRYIAQDDEAQSAMATKLIEGLSKSAPGYITMIVMVETYWVLCRAYKIDKRTVGTILEDVSTAQEIVVEQADSVGRALRLVDRGADFADALIGQLSADAGCKQTYTFDKGAAKLTEMSLLKLKVVPLPQVGRDEVEGVVRQRRRRRLEPVAAELPGNSL